MSLILLILSVAPVIFFGYQIYKRDFDKEPKEILIKLFFCGVGSTIVTLIITSILVAIIPFFGYESSKLSIFELIPYIFIGVALVEEFSKWIFVYKLEYNDKEFNHLYDGIVYAAFVALGFACFENILYVFQFGIGTAITRAFLAIPGHLCDGIMMGYYLSMAKLSAVNNNKGLVKKNLIFSLLVPTLAHGIYDYLIFAAEASGIDAFMVAFFIFVVVFFLYASSKVKQLSTNYYNLNPAYVPQSVLISNNTVGYDANIVHQYQQQMGYVYNQNMMYQNSYQQPTGSMIYNNNSYPQQTGGMMYQNNGYPQQAGNMMYQNNGYPQQTSNMMYQNNSYAQSTNNMMYQNNSYVGQTNVAPQVPVSNTCPNCGAAVVGKYCGSCGKEM